MLSFGSGPIVLGVKGFRLQTGPLIHLNRTEEVNFMANNHAARVTGLVLKVETRSGSKDGREWSMTTARVLVGGEDVCDVSIPNRDGRPVILTDRGEQIDWVVSIRQASGYLNIDFVKPWADVEALV